MYTTFWYAYAYAYCLAGRNITGLQASGWMRSLLATPAGWAYFLN